jgi:hypothetical protein
MFLCKTAEVAVYFTDRGIDRLATWLARADDEDGEP